MRTKQEILDDLNSQKEKYQNNIIRYNEMLDYLSHDSNDYKIYHMLLELDRYLLTIIMDELDYFTYKGD